MDFEAIYRAATAPGGPPAPWQIGEPQPTVVAVTDAGQITSEVLDAGCGLGDNAIFLARRGYRVTGVDGSPTAITRARDRARSEGVAVDFAVADATTLDGYDGRFSTVVDSGLYHCLSPAGRRAYATALHRAGKPDATLHLLCFCAAGPSIFPPENVVTAEELADVFGSAGWHVRDLRRSTVTAAYRREEMRESLATADTDRHVETRLDALDELAEDERGRLKLPVWKLFAARDLS